MARTALLGLVVRQYKDEDPFPQAVRNSWRTKAIPALFALSISGSYLHIWAGRYDVSNDPTTNYVARDPIRHCFI
jgi:hypothetical protein